MTKARGSWELLRFGSKGDVRGELVALEQYKEIPFTVKRVYYMIETKEGVRRGSHAHRRLDQVLIAATGSCKVLVDNGAKREIFELSDCKHGLRITDLVWREMYDFSPECVLLVLASELYDPGDYVRDYQRFAALAAGEET